jgi:tRNA modification GTPase
LVSVKNINKKKFRCSNQVNEIPTLTRQRHRDNLLKCIQCIDTYLINSKSNSEYQDIVLLAEELRNSTKWLGMITGSVSNEQVLDVIFRDFCIGK